jgi:hypothetical protein
MDDELSAYKQAVQWRLRRTVNRHAQGSQGAEIAPTVDTQIQAERDHLASLSASNSIPIELVDSMTEWLTQLAARWKSKGHP